MLWEMGSLVALVLALAAAIEGEVTHWLGGELPGRWSRVWIYLRAIGTGVAVWAAYAYVDLPTNVLWGMNALAAALAVLGYWKQVQNFGARVVGR